jgi:hypothetical protein
MFAFIRSRLLQLMRVPHDPVPPFGAPGSIRVFRAGKNFFYVRLARWIAAQVGAVIGIAVSIAFLAGVRNEYNAARRAETQPPPAAASAAVNPSAPAPAPTRTEFPRDARTKKNRDSAKRAVAQRIPTWVLPLVEVLELVGIAGFLFQLPVTFAAVRLDWEMRWYIVTDRSLRIRAGIWSLQETTMSFANLQQVEMSQGPLQRLLGIADVRVQSAGGGSVPEHGKDAGESLHTGIFHGVDNAQEIRDLILERLRLFRQAGLGDPDDPHAAHDGRSAHTTSDAPAPSDALAAARELLAETRALRGALSRPTSATGTE